MATDPLLPRSDSAPTVTPPHARIDSARSTSKDSPSSDPTELAKPTPLRDPAPQLPSPTSAATRTAADLQEAAVRVIHGSTAPPHLDHASVVYKRQRQA